MANPFDVGTPMSSNPVPNANIDPITGQTRLDPVAQILQQQKWLTHQVLQPTTRLDIDGNRVDPTAPSGLDWLEAHSPNRASVAARSAALGHEAGTMSPEAAGAAAMFNRGSALDHMSMQPDRLGSATFEGDLPYGSAQMHKMGVGEEPRQSTIDGQHSGDWFFEHAFKTPEGTSNPAMHGMAQRLGPDKTGQLAADRGFGVPPGISPPREQPFQSNPMFDAQAAHAALVRSAHPTTGFTGSSMPTVAPAPTVPSGAASHFPSLGEAVTRHAKPIPQTGVYPAARDNLYQGAGELGDWLMMKLFGTTGHNRYGEDGPMKPKPKAAPAAALMTDPYGYAG